MDRLGLAATIETNHPDFLSTLDSNSKHSKDGSLYTICTSSEQPLCYRYKPTTNSTGSGYRNANVDKRNISRLNAIQTAEVYRMTLSNTTATETIRLGCNIGVAAFSSSSDNLPSISPGPAGL